MYEKEFKNKATNIRMETADQYQHFDYVTK